MIVVYIYILMGPHPSGLGIPATVGSAAERNHGIKISTSPLVIFFLLLMSF